MSSHTMFSVGPRTTAPRNSTTLGWRMDCIMRTSPANSSMDSPLAFLSCICFSATSVPSQSAVNTSPNEPLPMRAPSVNSSGGITQRPAA